MSHTETKPITNGCPQAEPDQAGCCGSDKISEDGKRHHCGKPSRHADDVHSCGCGATWKHVM